MTNKLKSETIVKLPTGETIVAAEPEIVTALRRTYHRLMSEQKWYEARQVDQRMRQIMREWERSLQFKRT